MVKPKISIIIPVAPNSKFKKTLEAIRNVDYDKNKLEIFIIKGKNPSRQRNKGIKLAKGEIILFLDNDSIIEKDYIQKMIKKHESYDVVGGPAITLATDSFLQKSFGFVLGSYLATQKMQSKFRKVGKARKATEKELILCNLSIKKKTLDKYGLFNEKLYPNEENELLNRFQKNNVKILYDPEIVIFRSQRKNIKNFMKQIYTYGLSRMEHFKLKPNFTKPIFFMPSLFVLYLISLIFFKPSWYLIPLILYIALDLVFSIEISIRERKLWTILTTPLLFLILHISYGLGIFRGIFKRRKSNNNEVQIKKITWK